MPKLQDYTHHYKGLYGCDSQCHIQVYGGVGRQAGLSIVIATELEEKEATSITNLAEQLAMEIGRTHGISPNRLVWIERYMDRGCFISARLE